VLTPSKRVWLLRDAPDWASALKNQGYELSICPVMRLVPMSHPKLALRVFNKCIYDIAIWLSPNAVRYTKMLVPSSTFAHQHIAVGPSTTKALQSFMPANPILLPQNHDFHSEGVLALPLLQSVAHQKIILIKGVGGRRTLRKCLMERSAHVSNANVYRRFPNMEDALAWQSHWRNAPPHWVVCSSVSSLRALGMMLGNLKEVAWQSMHLLASSTRIAHAARRMGIHSVSVSGVMPCDPDNFIMECSHDHE